MISGWCTTKSDFITVVDSTCSNFKTLFRLLDNGRKPFESQQLTVVFSARKQLSYSAKGIHFTEPRPRLGRTESGQTPALDLVFYEKISACVWTITSHENNTQYLFHKHSLRPTADSFLHFFAKSMKAEKKTSFVNEKYSLSLQLKSVQGRRFTRINFPYFTELFYSVSENFSAKVDWLGCYFCRGEPIFLKYLHHIGSLRLFFCRVVEWNQ